MEVKASPQFLARTVLELPIMRRALVELLLSPSRRLEHPALVDLVARESGLSGSTASRRAQTLRRWFAWLGQALGPVRVGRGSIELVAPARVEELRLF